MAVVYKVCSEAEWAHAVCAGVYAGSIDDRRDGFIHLSSGSQLAGTLAKHFAGRPALVLIALDAASLAGGLRWEPSRGGTQFPHLYGDLAPGMALWVRPIAVDGDGRHIVPEDLP